MRIIRILLTVTVAVVLGLIALIAILPGEKIAAIAADQVKAATGRDLTFEGDVGISWYPTLGVSTGKVTFGNAPWSENGPMFSAQKAAIGVDVLAALTGNIRVKKIELIGPDILLEKTADGHANWDITPSSGAVESDPTAVSTLDGFAPENMVVRDARLRLLVEGETPTEITRLGVILAWADRSAPAQITISAQPAKSAVNIDATVVDLDSLLSGSLSELTAVLTAAKGTVHFQGRAGLAPEAAGTVTADLPDADAFLAALGLAGALQGPASLTGDVTLTRDMQLSLRKGSLTAFGNVITTQADVDLGGARPVVKAQIAAQKLDLTPSVADKSAEGGGVSSKGSSWSKAAIDASALGLIDGTISLAAEAVDLGDYNLGRTRATVTIDNSRAVAKLSELHAFEGTITGRFVANNRNGLSVRADLDVAQIALQPFLSATAGLGGFTGKADLKTSVLGSGQSLFAIMNSLKGEGSVTVGRGTIEGIDLDKLLRGDITGGTTVFDNMTATWTILKGVMRNEDLLMELPRLAATGSGTIGLGLRTINYIVSPQIRGDDAPLLIVPVKIEGSWDDPSIAPDMDQVIKQNLDEERKALEQKAQDKLAKELGVTAEENQSTEDAVKKKLEEDAKKGLLKLLGGD
ncbi:putative assembly protein [Shimia sp. SK013]|uniref:AsmA family protein n=1 Tax=Shimia sp. SK013 TaxID=1389006 RepID=UPI0006B52BBD|nr:AsmA family protein [Shimia sp. SK013]KPA21865.1 putative assembly protein [Shimia sp. SK013]